MERLYRMPDEDLLRRNLFAAIPPSRWVRGTLIAPRAPEEGSVLYIANMRDGEVGSVELGTESIRDLLMPIDENLLLEPQRPLFEGVFDVHPSVFKPGIVSLAAHGYAFDAEHINENRFNAVSEAKQLLKISYAGQLAFVDSVFGSAYAVFEGDELRIRSPDASTFAVLVGRAASYEIR